MKKYMVSFFLIAWLLPSCILLSYANDGYAVSSHQFLPSQIVELLSGDLSVFLLECDPSAGQVQWVSWVSYDFLSELSVSWRSAGVIVYNKTMDAYFIRVSYLPTISTSGGYKYCSLGTSNGYVLGSHAPSDSTTYNIYNYNQTTITHHSNTTSGTTSTPYVSSSWADRRLQEELYKDVDYINQRMSIANGYLSNIGWLLIDIRSYIEKNIVPGIEALNNNMVSFMGSAVSRLDDAVNLLSSIQSASWASVDVENRLLSSLDDLSSNISSVIVDGAVKVTSSPDPAVAESLTGIQSALTSISDQITEQFGEYDGAYAFPSAYAFPNVLHGETSTRKLYGVLSSSFSEVPDNSDLLYSSSSSVQVYGSLLIGTSTNGIADYYCVKCVPAYSAAYGLYYPFTVEKGFEEPCTDTRKYETMPVSFSVTDLGGAVHSFEFSVSFALFKGDSIGTTSFFVYPSWASDGTWQGWYIYYRQRGFSMATAQLTTDGEPTVRLLASPPDTDQYFLYSKTSEAVPVVYASRFTGFLQAQADRLVNAVGSIPAPHDYTAQLASVTDKLDALLEKSNDTVVNVINNNTYVTNVFQLDADTDVVDTAKDGVDKISSLFKWLWNNTFKGSFNAADVSALDGLFYDPAAAAEEVPDGS